MKSDTDDYSLYFRFIEKYSPAGFKAIDSTDPLMVEIESMNGENNQFFLIADYVQMAILFTSKRCETMMGIEPKALNPHNFFEATHPDDMHRHSLGRSALFTMTQDLFTAGKGNLLLSTNLHMRNRTGEYTNLLVQCYLFYATTPMPTAYLLEIHTDVDWFNKRKYGFHYYLGDDLANFRLPDEELLMLGEQYTAREFEIISLIKSGLSSEQIAEKIFLSLHTVNTHRKNILSKSGRETMPELIRDLLNRGVL